MRLQLSCLAALLLGLCWAGPASATSTFSFQRLTLTLPASFGQPTQLQVADLDGVNGPDIVVMGRPDNADTADFGIFLNKGDDTFELPRFVNSECGRTFSFAVGQFSMGDTNPDLIVSCIGRVWHRLRGDGDGNLQFDPTRDEFLITADAADDYGALSLGSFGTSGSRESLVYTHYYYSGAGGAGLFCFFPVSQLVADLDSGATYQPVCGGGMHLSYVLAAAPFPWPDNAAYGTLSTYDRHLYLVALVYSGAPAGWREITFEPPSFGELLGWISSAGRFITGQSSAQLVTVNPGQSLLALYDPAAATEMPPGYWLLPPPKIVHTGGPNPLGRYPDVTTSADFNRDGNLDLAVLVHDSYWPYATHDDRSLVEIHPGRGDGTFGSSQAFSTRAGWGGFEPLVVSDVNGDGYPDLVNLDTYAPAGQPRYATVLLNTTGQKSSRSKMMTTRSVAAR